MGFVPDEKAPPGSAAPQGEEKRWLNVLEEVVEEQETGRPWWQNLGIFLAWAAGFAVAAALAATLILGIVELFKSGRQFTVRTLSDYVFWASALLMLGGLLSPTSGGPDAVAGKKGQSQVDAGEGRSTRILRQRMRRMYDPWRWRLWAGAILAFGLSVLVGLAATP
jgi:cytochrome c biogenesis protein CcdA